MGQALINAFDHATELSEEELRAVAGGNAPALDSSHGLTNALPEMSTGMSGFLSMGSAPPLAEAADHESPCALPEVCSGMDLVEAMVPQGESVELPDAPFDESDLPGLQDATSDVLDPCVDPSNLLGRFDDWLSEFVDPLNPEATPESAHEIELPEGAPVVDLDAKGGGMEVAEASHGESSLPETDVRDGAGSSDLHGATDRGAGLPEVDRAV